ncbi:hypothetical protein DET65_2263 [Sunxiuqinia elliptica]|uniref:Uncharacterized protein n=1 Tax=Sunxiuqinia elliptica TaxID=655355 RepID=A0A4R6GSX9_9BACT|nr:hypothetical protein DET52_108140 [Sunxiuqinia elliptica]TDO60458.1 hypothetical protein DET65_2263 [Sunxiuqinia elliptica]
MIGEQKRSFFHERAFFRDEPPLFHNEGDFIVKLVGQ